ncbi:ABC transporter permease subunit [Pseudomonas sp. GX19020]|uniref:ABC transporter permease subunit n=1 Tax=Pseudomonas sp. GX19020 TaxID=2942277 RepID=UPI0020195CC9|nr:ABC transporter permease subunit [Pseudomonas sp. GX19020]MCL4068115.1 ABC transporter permease subunit [Pseudomonas sp. GX19020]
MTVFTPYRLRRLRRSATQIAVIGIAVGLLAVVGLTVRNGFAARGVDFSFAFLLAPAGFEISEGKTLTADGFASFASAMTNTQALVAGLSNTIKVAITAIALSTVIGVMLGVSRLSTNWLIRKLAFGAIEFLRNTPLLIQLTFWYVAVVLKLPGIREAQQFWGAVISQQGIWLPRPMLSDGPGLWIAFLAVLIGLAALFPAFRAWRAWAGGMAVVLFMVAILVGFRIFFDYPEVGRFRAEGGFAISPEFTALLIAMTVNSAAYIGEIVRGAIEALPRGQWEAAEAIGLSRRHVLGDVVLPQVLRVVMPSFGNQYISLTKNTSLGIAIGFPDLFNVYGTVSNQTGRSLEGVILAMGIYLVLSWIISLAVNLVNRRLKIPGVR